MGTRQKQLAILGIKMLGAHSGFDNTPRSLLERGRPCLLLHQLWPGHHCQGNRTGFRVRLKFRAAWPWVNHLTSLILSFLLTRKTCWEYSWWIRTDTCLFLAHSRHLISGSGRFWKPLTEMTNRDQLTVAAGGGGVMGIVFPISEAGSWLPRQRCTLQTEHHCAQLWAPCACVPGARWSQLSWHSNKSALATGRGGWSKGLNSHGAREHNSNWCNIKNKQAINRILNNNN
jgi:hypothetical protein